MPPSFLLPTTTERPDVAYSLVAVDFLPPPAVNASLNRLAADLASDALRPLPRVLHEVAAVRAALRQMSQARHVGKIVVRARTLQQQQGTSKVNWLAVLAWLLKFIYPS
jgi:NADPH:quinone reductase-like Zn-dependent oxidoreductase